MTDNENAAPTNKRRRVVSRPRPIVSCLSCRAKKLKCDRTQPCRQCQAAGRAVECLFAGGTTPKEGTPSARPQAVRAAAIAPRQDHDLSWSEDAGNVAQSTPGLRPYTRQVADHQQSSPEENPRDIYPLGETLKIKQGSSRYHQGDFKRIFLQKVRTCYRNDLLVYLQLSYLRVKYFERSPSPPLGYSCAFMKAARISVLTV